MMFSNSRIFDSRRLCLLLYSSLCLNQLTEALIPLPNNVRIDTEVSFNAKSESELFTVEEFIDRLGGSIQLKVIPKGSEEDDIIKYYRIKEYAVKSETKPQSEKVMSYSIADNICRETQLNAWLLRELSGFIKTLVGIENIDTSSIRNDRTAIGPTALLQIVQANAYLFSLESEVYDEMRFSDVYLFQTRFSLNENELIRIIVSFAKTNVRAKETLVTARTLLSETITSAFPNTISVAIYNKEFERYKPDYESLYKLVDGESKKLAVSFYLLQENSFSKQLGVKPGKGDEQNPFSLPAAAGCGASSRHNIFYVAAKQFSGLYKARGSANKHYIAYDSLTDNLRLDVFGEYKMVYDMKEKLVTYMMQGSLTHMFEAEHDSNPDINYYDLTHCAQTYLTKEEDDGFYASRILEDILGFDTYRGLMYLGTKFLEDGTHCLVFEREVDWRQLPLIVRNNLLKKVKKEQKLFLVYYFVDELTLPDDGDRLFSELTYKSMWLKRIELLTLDVKFNLRTLNSMITFSEFSWSLDSMAEDAQNLNSKILHPVRTFDTIECKSTRAQNKLEMLIKKVNSSSGIGEDNGGKNERPTKVDSFEEGLMVFLSEQMRLSRTLINELELIVPQSDDEESFLVKAKLADPMSFIQTRELIGWIKSVDSFPFEKYGRFLRTERMSRHECSLLLATYLSKRKKIYMTYCPNFGCAYLHDTSLEYTKKNSSEPADFSDSFDMCEIYEQKKVVNYNIIANKLTDKALQRNLNGSQILISVEGKSLSDPQTIEEGIFRGTVVKTLTTKGISHDSLGILIKTGVCYSKETRVESETPFELSTTELHLDLHHSLVYCHKACQLFPDCQTYSYVKASRICTLTNIHRKLLNEDSVGNQKSKIVGFIEDSTCNLYAINSVRLYDKDASVLVTSPAGYNTRPGRHYYYSLNNLPDCAGICHTNELTTDNRMLCQKFDFFPLISVCVIEDPDLNLYKNRQLEGSEKGFNDGNGNNTYAVVMAQEEWFSSHHCFRYKRDYAQHYAAEEWTSVKLARLNETGATTVINLGADEEQVSDVGTVLYDLNEEDCLRECTIINSECLAVNYCEHRVKNRYLKYCFMFRIRSPLLIREGKAKLEVTENRDRALKATLTKLEAQYFIEKNSTDRFMPIEDRTCTHYYLEGDNLTLKRLLMKSVQGSGHQSRAVDELAKKDLLHSMSYLSLVRDYASSKVELISVLLLIMAGASVGLVVSFFGPEFIDRDTVIRASSLAVKKTQSKWNRFKREERSQSTVEFNVELDDIRAE